MSYILDALRKSEQQRQATQPENATDRILVAPPEPKQKPTKWIAALVISNLLIIGYFAWFFTQKDADEPKHQANIVSNPEKQLLPITPEKKLEQPTVIAQPQISPTTDQTTIVQAQPAPKTPSIAELVEARKLAEMQRQTEKHRPRWWKTNPYGVNLLPIPSLKDGNPRLQTKVFLT
jgi:general secretion pathway protein B